MIDIEEVAIKQEFKYVYLNFEIFYEYLTEKVS